ncbi:hypothetical protein QBC32DRAFT_214872 [Pseudoneurospora amorphoporcata]|uniref:PHD-type domain-containing protein n=1 Tax=Pseudoneurospora amorphoporcata TaxID=241081 RepID=A0AAN6SFX0_9PEZI|nr:hypothetical protein QBC32DRAFT_214872 [Pseudoneurospora amorphoporcata]
MTSRCRRYRQLPFLHRNWIHATNYWEDRMGNKPSTQSRVPAHESDVRFIDHSHHTDQDFDDTCQHPAKRRRRNDNNGFPLYEDPCGDSPRCLRIEVLKIIHEDSPRIKNGVSNGMVAPNVRDTANMRARCKLSIYGHNGNEKVLLHVDSQLCELKVYKNPAAASTHMARLYAIEAFDIPEDKIYLERDGHDPAFGFADSYSVLIEIESAGDPNWPPSSLIPAKGEEDPSARNLPPRQWALFAQLPDIFHTRNRKTTRLKARIQQNRETPTDFVMDIDVRWQTSISSQLTGNQNPKEIMPSITVIDPWAPKKPLSELPVTGSNGVNGINGHHHDPTFNDEATKMGNWEVNGTSTADAGEELLEGDLTPNRSRRHRTEVNYNVRQLWNTAVGKSPRKRRRDDDEHAQLDEHSVTYVLPPEEGRERKALHANKLSCLVCAAEHERISQLRAHFSCHPEFDFKFEQKKGLYLVAVQRVGAVVGNTSSTTASASPLKPGSKIIYSLGLPVKPLDLAKFVDGDDSWVRSRLLPDHGGYKIPPLPASRSPTKGPHPQQQQQQQQQRQQKEKSLSATSASTRSRASKEKPQKKPVYVPHNINRPIYDPLSKVELAPGSEVRYPPLDEGWLITKHADALGEFSDVEPQEKEYMMQWDAYILQKHLGSEQYLPREFRNFVKEKAAWLLEKRSRAEELGKHMAVLLARRYLDDATVVAVTKELNEVRKSMAAAGGGGGAEGASAAGGAGGDERARRESEVHEQQQQQQQPGGGRKKSAAGGCARCGEVVPQPEMMICCNKHCKQRVYHSRCVPNPEEALELVRRRKWKCFQCEAVGH